MGKGFLWSSGERVYHAETETIFTENGSPTKEQGCGFVGKLGSWCLYCAAFLQVQVALCLCLWGGEEIQAGSFFVPWDLSMNAASQGHPLRRVNSPCPSTSTCAPGIFQITVSHHLPAISSGVAQCPQGSIPAKTADCKSPGSKPHWLQAPIKISSFWGGWVA